MVDARVTIAQPIIPEPVKIATRAGHFTLTARTAIVTDKGNLALGHQLARYLEPATGLVFRVVTSRWQPGRLRCGSIRR